MNIFVKLFNNINRGDILTNINCSSNCVYQKDGKCCFENVSKQQVTPNNNCAYYLSVSKATTNK